MNQDPPARGQADGRAGSSIAVGAALPLPPWLVAAPMLVLVAAAAAIPFLYSLCLWKRERSAQSSE